MLCKLISCYFIIFYYTNLRTAYITYDYFKKLYKKQPKSLLIQYANEFALNQTTNI